MKINCKLIRKFQFISNFYHLFLKFRVLKQKMFSSDSMGQIDLRLLHVLDGSMGTSIGELGYDLKSVKINKSSLHFFSTF
jgi:hypothetical protein